MRPDKFLVKALLTRSVPAMAVVCAVIGTAVLSLAAQDVGSDAARRQPALGRLAPTAHPPLPGQPSHYWLLPETASSRASSIRSDDAINRLVRGVRLIASKEYASALPLVRPSALAGSPVATYAQYYNAIALEGLNRTTEARGALASLHASRPEGFLKVAVPLELAKVALAAGDAKAAVGVLEELAASTLPNPEEVWLQLGRAAEAAGNAPRALDAYRTVYYDYPMSAQAADAQSGIERLQTPALIPADRFKRDLARAERLFAARRWSEARAAFQPLGRAASSADARELIALRLAESDYYLDRARAARDAVRPFLESSSRKAEAQFFYLTAVRALGDIPTYERLAKELVAEFPESSWSEETLNNLASHYIIQNDDQRADDVFRELARRFPRSRYGERAAWKIGWWAYKNGRFGPAAETFEAAAITFPRADMRPAWIYWAGRSRDQLGDAATANSRYRLAATDYLNSYYGRLASRLLTERRQPPVQSSVSEQPASQSAPLIPTDALVRQLVSAGLYDDARRELEYAQRVWGDTPALQATIAWIRHEQGLQQQSMDRFLNIRGAITLMKRAYPQYLAAGGEDLPPEVLRVMFPLDHWPLIQKYSAQHKLDPYLMAALIAQESTFTADVRSAANAYGLMQLIPDTARQYARKVGLRYTRALLTQPDANVRMGMQYFKDLSDRFGGDHFALASYNAGPHRVARWKSERPGIAQDEFIDDIPFPETQNYVKRILGQAEDYRRLYGGGILKPLSRPAASTAPRPRG